MKPRVRQRVGPISFGITPRACTILNNLLLVVGPASFGIAPRACMILNKLVLLLPLLLLLLLLQRVGPISIGIAPRACTILKNSSSSSSSSSPPPLPLTRLLLPRGGWGLKQSSRGCGPSLPSRTHRTVRFVRDSELDLPLRGWALLSHGDAEIKETTSSE